MFNLKKMKLKLTSLFFVTLGSIMLNFINLNQTVNATEDKDIYEVGKCKVLVCDNLKVAEALHIDEIGKEISQLKEEFEKLKKDRNLTTKIEEELSNTIHSLETSFKKNKLNFIINNLSKQEREKISEEELQKINNGDLDNVQISNFQISNFQISNFQISNTGCFDKEN